MVISENRRNFIVLNYKVLQTIIAMLTENKVTELFCMADDFCKFFDAMMENHRRRTHHGTSLLVAGERHRFIGQKREYRAAK